MNKKFLIIICMLVFLINIMAVKGEEYYYNNYGQIIKTDYGTDFDYGVKSINCFYDDNQNLLRKIKIIQLDGAEYSYVEDYNFDGDGNLLSYNSLKENLILMYDGDGNLIQRKENNITIGYVYDSFGKIIKEISSINTTYDYDDYGRINCINCQSDASDTPESYVYDSEGNVIEYKFGNSIAVNQTFVDGKIMSKSDSYGSLFYIYDGENLTELNDSGFLGENIIFNSCDSYDNYTYDEFCNVIEDDYYFYEYDDNNMVIEARNKENEETISYEYDNKLRLTQINYPDGTNEQYIYGGEVYKYLDRYENDYYFSPIESILIPKSELLAILTSCSGDCGEIEINYSCDDRIRNGYEEGIDCGLSCMNECDILPPNISIVSPSRVSYMPKGLNLSSMLFNVNSDEELKSCNLSLDNWTTNYSMIIDEDNKSAYANLELNEGSYNVKFFCSDIAENMNNIETEFIFAGTNMLCRIGDFDNNKNVNFWDFMKLSNIYGVNSASPKWLAGKFDFDFNNEVNFWDFMKLIDIYGCVYQ